MNHDLLLILASSLSYALISFLDMFLLKSGSIVFKSFRLLELRKISKKNLFNKLCGTTLVFI